MLAIGLFMDPLEAMPLACSSAITSVAASSTTPNPSRSNWRRTALFPAPGVAVRINRFIQNRSISPPSGSFRNFRKRYANLS